MVSLRYLILGATFVFALSGCNDEKKTPPPPPPLPTQEVRVAQTTLEPVTNQIELLGTIEAVNRVEIAAQISGNITKLPVVLGSTVKKGDLIATISAGDINAKLSQSKSQLEQARRNLTREEKLLRKKAATREKVRSMQEAVDIAAAAYREAQTFESYTSIRTPISGRITRKHVNVGDLATPGKPLVNIEDSSRLQVITDIPERFISKVRHGDHLTIEVPSAGIHLTGVVAEVAPTANPTTRTAPVKLDIPASSELYGGQFVRVALTTDQVKTLTIPQEALLPIGQMERVFVAEDGKARLRLVRSGKKHQESVEILSGLNAESQVIVAGQHNLKDGQPIIIK